MVSKLSKVKSIILSLLADGKEHSSDEIRSILIKEGVELDKKSGALRTAIYQLRTSGVEIYSRDRGIYQMKENENGCFVLKNFTTLMPEKKISPKCIYIHEDGSLVFNGKLNQEIESREVEIKIHNNGKAVALIPNGEYCHKFTKSGRTKNAELVKKLKSKHIDIPATFEMEQDEDSGIWFGKLRSDNNKEKGNLL